MCDKKRRMTWYGVQNLDVYHIEGKSTNNHTSSKSGTHLIFKGFWWKQDVVVSTLNPKNPTAYYIHSLMNDMEYVPNLLKYVIGTTWPFINLELTVCFVSNIGLYAHGQIHVVEKAWRRFWRL